MNARIIKARELKDPLVPWRPEPARTPQAGFVTARESPNGPDVDTEAAARAAREKGLAEGMRLAEEAYREKLSRLETMLASVQRERAEFFDRIEPELVRLSVTIAEKVISQELAVRPDVVVDIVRGAMKRLRDREQVRISVNPGDLEQVRGARDDLISAVDGVRKLEIVEDRRVSPGGCVIESPNGTLDARIETQLNEIVAAVEGALPGPTGGV